MATEAPLTHPFVSAKADGPDVTKVKPTNWNANHVAAGGTDGQSIGWDNLQTSKMSWVRYDHINYAYNSDFNLWGDGIAVAPTGWRVVGSGAVIGRDAVNFKYSLYGASLQRNANDCYLAQDVSLVWSMLQVVKSRKVTLGAWVKCSTSGVARLVVADGVGTSASTYHTGGGSFEFLKVEHTVSATATILELRLQIDTGNATAVFDGVIIAFCGKPELDDYYPGVYAPVKTTLYFGSVTGQPQNTTRYYGPFGLDAAEIQVSMPSPSKGILRSLRLLTDIAPAGVTTAIGTIRTAETTDSAIVAVVTGPAREGSDLTNQVAVNAGTKIALKIVTAAASGNLTCRATLQIEATPDAY